jgi:SAM-dependent methyltransferase
VPHAGRLRHEARADSGRPWQPVTRHGRRAGQYQSFGDAAGASDSRRKLDALRLALLPNRVGGKASPLAGLSVLDLGCNEGFFCGEALRQGARRVVGIDMNDGFLARARRRFPGAEFVQGSWWEIPDEKFDVILFLSAIHYEADQRRLLQKLAGHLTPTGALVLECGVAGTARKVWEAVKRGDGVRRYHSTTMLAEELLKPYAVRAMGPSVMQGGDPVPRQVFHCYLRRSTALLFVGPSTTGKSTLTRDLARRDIPLISTDQLLGQILRDKRYDWSPVAAVVRRFPTAPRANYAKIGKAVAAECPREFVEILMLEAPSEADLFCIEGEILVHAPVMDELLRRLDERCIRPWLVEPHRAAEAAAPSAAGDPPVGLARRA